MASILSARNYNVSFGKRRVLVDVNFDIEEIGITHLMGPFGAGKSVLIQSLAGLSQKSSSFRSSGSVIYLGDPIDQRERPLLLEQKPSILLNTVFDNIVLNLPERSDLSHKQKVSLVSRLLNTYEMTNLEEHLDTSLSNLSLVERRMALILGLVATAPALLMLDEPTANLDNTDAKLVLDAIQAIAQYRAVILVQHNQQQAKQYAGNAMLMAGGTIQESGLTTNLLGNPQSQAGKEFKGTGTCAIPDPNTDPEALDPEYVERYKSAPCKIVTEPHIIPYGPQGFHWIQRGKLAATPRPGLFGELEFDLKALAKVQIDSLISLEEEPSVPEQPAQELGISIRHMAIPDMQAPPSMQNTLELLQEMEAQINAGRRLAVHCRAGLGRTGTILAAYLVFTGMKPIEALRKVRCADPRMVQSEEQEQFIEEFSDWLLTSEKYTSLNPALPD